MLELTLARRDGGWLAEVTVRGDTDTKHRVTVRREARDRLAGDRTSVEDLVRASFEFLLEREPNTAILREFDLDAISRYFPDYVAEMQRRFDRA